MSSYVLLHGGWAGGWVWERAVEPLRADGHRVVTPDLAGHGAEGLPMINTLRFRAG
ncbi:MAG: alpha/beta fold hydrolase [Actinophytocola sp.]|nr:alpha/beta fold hydrolase [Actinophytocola sp.]